MAHSGIMTSVSALALAAAMALPAAAEVKIGFLSDMSGPTSVLTGESSQRAIEMAIEDFGGEVNGEPIELIVSDHLSKPDVGLAAAREWIDAGDLNLLFSADQSAVALAVSDLLRDKDVAFIHGASSSKLTNDSCGPNQIQMLMDSHGLSRAITIPLVEAGRDKWYYITVDYAFGHDLEDKGVKAIQDAGGEFLGSVKHSPQTSDFSAFLLEAQAKGAETIGLATFGTWQIAIAKQAQEFGVDAALAPYFLGITDIKAAGLDSLQNVNGAIQFYWDQNDKTREFSERFQERYGRPPTFTNAMHYEYITHYLKAVEAAGSTDTAAVIAKMREMPIQLINGETATIREDGRTMRPMYSYRTKKPADSKGDWDYLEITGTIPAESLAPPLSESTCAFVKS